MFILFLFKDSSFYWTGNKVYGILKEQEDFFGDLLCSSHFFYIFAAYL